MKVDVAVIGAGSAGLAALGQVRLFTSDFALVDGAPSGTTCARAGCMPSKALIQIADDFHRRRVFLKEGITGGGRLALDTRTVMARIRTLRDGFMEGPIATAAAFGRRRVEGYAHFVEPTVLRVGATVIRAKAVVIATGSSPWIPPQWRPLGPRLITSENLFDLRSLPSSLAVIGVGGVGLELSQALSRLGVKVTAFGASGFVGDLDDPFVNRRAIAVLGKEIPLVLGHECVIRTQASKLLVSSEKRRVIVDNALIAIGRRPNIEGLELEGLGIKFTRDGHPDFDPSTMQIGELPIFLAGDASSDRPVLHEALDAGRIAGFNAAQAGSSCFERRVKLGIIFSHPNIAFVGATWASLKGTAVAVGEADFARQGRAIIMGENAGLLRVYAQRRSGKLLGAQMAAPGGEHIAHLLAMAISRGMTVFEALETPFYHPVLEEGLKEALSTLAKKISRTRR